VRTVDPAFRRLLPEPGDYSAVELLASLRQQVAAPADRPYTLVNFASSTDGRIAFGGRSAPLGDDGDRALFHALRAQADAVLAGTGTLRAERYGRLIADEETRAGRRAAGLADEPLACVISQSGAHLPLEIPLFGEPSARIVLFTPSMPDLTGVRADVTVSLTDPTRTDPLRHALGVLASEHGVRLLLCEGGPTLFGALLRERVVDELFLTIAPKLAGGDSGPSVTAGPPLDELEPLRVAWLLERTNSLYLRYLLA
jgi:riboflavin biosynthesis pyrimidine reductase